MTVSSTTNRKSFAGDGVTTSFGTSPVVFFNSSELVVQIVVTATGAATTLVEGTNYTVTGGNGAVGTVNLAGGTSPNGAPSALQTLLIRRVLPLTQTDDFVNNAINDAEVTERRFDKTVMQIQQLGEEIGRGIVIPASETATAALTTLPFNRAGKFLAFDASKNPIASEGTVSGAVPVSAFMATVLDDTSAAAARATLGAAADAEFVKLTDNQTIAGVKTFSSKPILPATAPVGNEAVSARNAAPTFGGRITLTSGTPITTTDVTAATTVFFTSYRGNRVPLYDGTGFVMTAFSELSQATTDSTKSPSAVGNNLNYDIFVWDDAGTLRATRGPAWSSDTARGTGANTTELEVVNGIYVNRFAITNGPSAQRGTYVGTIRSNGSAQIVDSMTQRFVWNNYNRVPRPMRRLETTFTWTYNVNAWRYSNNSAANRLDVVRGLNEDAMNVMAQGQSYTTEGSFACMSAIGLDSSTAIATGVLYAQTDPGGAFGSPFRVDGRSSWRGFPGLGFHFLAWIENGLFASVVMTWEGAGSRGQNGIEAEVYA